MNDRQTILKHFTADQLSQMLLYLDGLRETGVTNMFGAGPYLVEEFSIGRAESHAVLAWWMETFDSRHPTEV